MKTSKGGGIMERLTERGSYGYGDVYVRRNDYVTASKKLCEYEDLEEQGLLLRLPCAVGSTVYLICSRYSECSKYKERFDEYSCQGCEEYECDSHKEYYIHINHSVSIEWIVRNLNNFGKTVFLTREEAEQKLKEMESE